MANSNTLKFTKMHGAGNDFVVLDNCAGQLELTPALIKRLADRHFGVGADQVLVVESSQVADFKYRIFNADGQEVQQCGNGARCFAQYVFDKGLTQKNQIKVETLAGIIQPELIKHNWVKVNMGPAEFEPAKVPFVSEGLASRKVGAMTQYKLPVDSGADLEELWVGVASMGNPHVVVLLEQPATDELVQRLGATLESHPRFPERVNVGFLYVVDRSRVHLRVYERGVGETLACGTGACAAAVVGMKMGLIADCVDVVKAGGTLTIEWSGQEDSHVLMTGPAQTVFEGEFHL
ncbi:diaminopimelate epimerase [Limnobacter parvus]|uniref:Diaminopimelate epimerase n=1 Tax=Limnobacter parvus TaxID=2939690 RepID=A0ABT1XGI9_9BURK|nr:diaminopimelate epimerase [Limnobacter parvus]MCR2746408.1 diaminopimelate epimerase [Limnobacter parvus]